MYIGYLNAYVQKYDVSKSQYINVQRYKYDLFYGNMYDNVQAEKMQIFLQFAFKQKKKKIVKPHLEKKKRCEFSTIESDMVKMIYKQKSCRNNFEF